MDKGFKRNSGERDTKQMQSFCIPDFVVGNGLQKDLEGAEVDPIEEISKK
jgi:hypothetical protein